MACEQFTLGNASATNNISVWYLDLKSMAILDQLIALNGLFGATCPQLIDIANQQIASTTTLFFKSGDTIDLTPLLDPANYTLQIPPGGAGSQTVDVLKIINNNGGTTAAGKLRVNFDASGIPTSIDNEMLVPLNFVTDTINNFGIRVYGFQFAITTQFAANNAVNSLATSEYVGCVVPRCFVAPTVALPQLGSTVKCANFSKIFNPLGISIKGTK